MTDHHDVNVPLNEYTRQVAQEAARTVYNEMQLKCPIWTVIERIDKSEERIDKLEQRFAYVIGAIVGSGALGGAVGASILKMFGA